MSGAALLAVAATAHLSAFIVLAGLGPWLVWAHWPDVKRDIGRRLALVAGLGAAAAYYGSFAGLVMSQLSRLGEGAGSAAQGPAAVLVRQVSTVAGQWGLPVLMLALLGRPRPSRGLLDRDLTAWWGAGLVLLALSAMTPLDVRWVYALGAAVASAAAFGFAWLWGRGRASRAGALGLLAAQVALGAWTASVALWERYR